jgi:hypothetical protein
VFVATPLITKKMVPVKAVFLQVDGALLKFDAEII